VIHEPDFRPVTSARITTIAVITAKGIETRPRGAALGASRPPSVNRWPHRSQSARLGDTDFPQNGHRL
jgi:hypothetical protein